MQRYEAYHQQASKHRPAFAILRVDAKVRGDTPFQRRVTVKKVVLSEEYAKAEVERLNSMNAAKGCQYVAQLTELDESDADRS
jgi:hypothetical protein